MNGYYVGVRSVRVRSYWSWVWFFRYAKLHWNLERIAFHLLHPSYASVHWSGCTQGAPKALPGCTPSLERSCTPVTPPKVLQEYDTLVRTKEHHWKAKGRRWRMASSPDPGNCLVPEEEEIQGAIERLTSTEKDIINEVLLRDEEIRSQEKQRLRFVMLHFLGLLVSLFCSFAFMFAVGCSLVWSCVLATGRSFNNQNGNIVWLILKVQYRFKIF